MLKVTLRERIKILWREGIWLNRLHWKMDSDNTISFYEGINSAEEVSLWAIDDGGLVKISGNKKCFLDFYRKAEDASYFFGTEGIFYKKTNEIIKKIYAWNDCKEISLFYNLGVICLVRNNNPDMLFKVTNGEVFKIMEGPICCINGKDIDCWSWTRNNENELNIIVQESICRYVYHYVDKDGEIYLNLCYGSDYMELYSKVSHGII